MHRSLRNLIVSSGLFLILFDPAARAQVYSSDGGLMEAKFVTRVMQLDEFIHRFNNDSSSELRQYYQAHHWPFQKDRAQLIRSLFNYSTQNWDTGLVTRFIRRATDPENPSLLGFMQDQWYAEAKCRFLYNSEAIDISLILKVRSNPDHSAEWVIAAVRPEFDLKQSPPIEPIYPEPKQHLFIQPTANDTYFAELSRDLSDKERLTDIFDKGFMRRKYSAGFYQCLLADKLRFVAVKAIKYHYLQVHDWVFTVEHFDRDTRNSGWLISGLRPLTPEQRTDFERKLLGE
jgi:hypothetical protein